MAVKRVFNMREQFFDSQGNVLNGGKLFWYIAGSSTKATTFNSSSGTVANSDPMILDAFGRLQSEVWVTAGVMLKGILTTSTDTDPPVSPIWSEDNISGINDTTVTLDQWVSGPVPTYVSATSFTLVGDQTTLFEKGRRLKLTDSGGTKYGTIDSSVFGALTTVVIKESVLATPVTAVSYGLLSTTNYSTPNDNITQTVASATTTNLDTSISHSVIVSGTTTITGITLGDGQVRFVEFSGALLLTNGASLILPGGANITTAAGDCATFRGEATGVVRCLSYSKANGKAVINTQPTTQLFITGSGTYTTPANAVRIKVRMVGGGGGGGASNTNGGATGGNTTFSTFTASGGVGGATSAGSGGAGGAAAGGTVNIPGGAGQGGATTTTASTFMPGGQGGSSAFGGNGPGGAGNNAPAIAAAANSGSGGGGAGGPTASSSGAGGGAGGYVEAYITSPAATYSYGVGAAGNGGAAGTIAGGNGAAGFVIVEEFYS